MDLSIVFHERNDHRPICFCLSDRSKTHEHIHRHPHPHKSWIRTLTYPLESAVMRNSLSSVTAAAPNDSVSADTALNLPKHRPWCGSIGHPSTSPLDRHDTSTAVWSWTGRRRRYMSASTPVPLSNVSSQRFLGLSICLTQRNAINK